MRVTKETYRKRDLLVLRVVRVCAAIIDDVTQVDGASDEPSPRLFHPPVNRAGERARALREVIAELRATFPESN